MPGKTNLSSEQVLIMLAAAPMRITELTAGLAPGPMHVRPDPDSWSANEVLAHLRACADMWGGAMRTILVEDEPTIRAINPRAWITQTNYLDLDFQSSLQSYAAQRAELVMTLESLPPEGWSRSATVTGAGKVLQRTVLFYGRWMAGHERPHLKQMAHIAEAMSSEQSQPRSTF